MWSLVVALLLLGYVSGEVVKFQNCPVSGEEMSPFQITNNALTNLSAILNVIKRLHFELLYRFA
jgi:hypothetical protein